MKKYMYGLYINQDEPEFIIIYALPHINCNPSDL